MSDSGEDALWFMGDLSDPWVVSIAEAMARCSGIVQVHCPGDLPVRPFGPDRLPRLIVIHRHRFTAVDAQRLKAYRVLPLTGQSPAILLCVSPYVRYDALERWSALVDFVVSEATAEDILPGYVSRLVERRDSRSKAPAGAGVRIEVAGANHDLCGTLVEACTNAGYTAIRVPDLAVDGGTSPTARPTAGVERTLTLWDVPVLEPDWSGKLKRRSTSSGPVIALTGFADREIVTLAKASGAIACLDLPFHVDDLIDVIDRAVSTLPPDRWPSPVRAEQPHLVPPPPRRRKHHRERPVHVPPWSDQGGN